jgi:hypothetical protein
MKSAARNGLSMVRLLFISHPSSEIRAVFGRPNFLAMGRLATEKGSRGCCLRPR